MKRNQFSLRSLVWFAFVTLSGAAQTVFNPTTDFSASSNPVGIWSYGYATSAMGTFNLFTASGDWSGLVGLSQWDRPNGGYPDIYPLVFKNTTNAPIVYGGGLTVAAGQFGLIGGPNGLVSIARLTLPATGSYSLSATFTRLEPVVSDVDVWVVIGGSTFVLTQTFSAVNATTSVSNYVFSASAGTTVDFVVGPNEVSSSGMNGDTTGLVATVTAIPEPATYAVLVGLVAAAVATLRVKRRDLRERAV